MYASGVRLSALALLWLLGLLLLPFMAYSGAAAKVAEAGPFDVYGEGSFFYAVFDPGNFDYVYKDRFYVKRFFSGAEYLEFNVMGFPGQVVARHLADIPQNWVVTSLTIYAPQGTGGSDDPITKVLESHGMSDVGFEVAKLAAHERGGKELVDLNVALLLLYVPNNGPSIKALERISGELLDSASRASNVRPSAILAIVEPFDRSLWSLRSDVVSKIIDSWKRDGMPIRGVGGGFLQPFKVRFDGVLMESMGVSEEEVLQWLDRVVPPGIPVIVEFWYFKTEVDYLTGDSPAAPNTPGKTQVIAASAMLAAASVSLALYMLARRRV